MQGNNAARSAYIEELLQLEQQAQAAGVGMWTKDPQAGALSVRNVVNPGPGGYDAKETLEAFKGQPQTLVVEQFRGAPNPPPPSSARPRTLDPVTRPCGPVMTRRSPGADGATVRGFMLPSFHWVTVFLSGVSCPGFKRSEEPGGADLAEPFASEAKYFVESRLLNRDVRVLLEGVDKYNNFYGTLQHPAGNISEELLKVGLAKVVDWSANFTKARPALRRHRAAVSRPAAMRGPTRAATTDGGRSRACRTRSACTRRSGWPRSAFFMRRAGAHPRRHRRIMGRQVMRRRVMPYLVVNQAWSIEARRKWCLLPIG